MKIDVHFTPAEIESAVLAEATMVIIDVVRATTCIVEALANGARAVFPTASTEEAVKLAASLGREDTLLCGERKGLKIEAKDAEQFQEMRVAPEESHRGKHHHINMIHVILTLQGNNSRHEHMLKV